MSRSRTSEKYRHKRGEILQAATAIINTGGLSGMTMKMVADRVRLTPATLTYYFKDRHDLAATVFERRVSAMRAMVAHAQGAASLDERLERLVNFEFDRIEGVLAGTTPALPVLPNSNEIAFHPEIEGAVHAIFEEIFRFFEAMDEAEDGRTTRARGYTFLGFLFFLSTWLEQYPVSEFARVRARCLSFLELGLANGSPIWNPTIFDVDLTEAAPGARDARRDFLKAATRLLNRSGYVGTSVDKIAEELNVTKGSFYHHFSSKDELVKDCIDENWARISRAIDCALEEGGTALQMIASTIATVLDLQFRQEWPLLRSTGFASLPHPLRQEATRRSNQIALRLAGLIADGMADGSVKPVDPLIASHIVISALYSAFGLQDWAARIEHDRAIELYAATMLYGLTATPSR